MSDFVSVADVSSLPPGTGRTVHVAGREFAIWNIDGHAGSAGQSQDLQITNTLSAPLHLQVVDQPDQQIVVQAAVGG